jgi:hypothetical protein
MPWATPTDYSHAIQNPASTLADEELRHGEVARNKRGLPLLWSGNFASVYRIHCPATGKTWALKCFTREVSARQHRYRHIAAALEAAHLPFTVPFVYLERGVQVHGQWFPAVKMEWVDGQTLNRFVEESLDKPKVLRQLLDLWPRLVGRLREAQIAHADLQHGNVLLVPAPDGKLAVKLIDYDGMYVPALAGTHSGELGHPNYQHPQRSRERAYSANVDRFSHLVIYCAVDSLVVGKRDLWQRFNNDENLLFREHDFQRPGQSEVFQTVWEIGDANARTLVGRLALACGRPLEATAWLDQIVQEGRAKALTGDEQQAVSSLMVGGKTAARAVVPAGAAATSPAIESPAATPDETSLRDNLGFLTTQGTGSPAARPRETALSDTRRAAVERTRPMAPPLRSRFRAAVRGLDGLFRRMVGEENTFLYNFLRLAIAATVIAGLVVGWCVYQRQRAEPTRQLAAVDDPGWQSAQQKAEREAARKKTEQEAAQKKAEQDAAMKTAKEDAAQINADFTGAQNALRRHGERALSLRGTDKDRLAAWKAAAEKGVPEAQWLLGCALGNGVQCQKDPDQAVKWFRKAAEQGSAPAQCSLGFRYSTGQGVPKDYEEAVNWYRKAAQQGDGVAQFDLGVCYQKGQGVPKDDGEAVKWLRKAAEQGSAPPRDASAFAAAATRPNPSALKEVTLDLGGGVNLEMVLIPAGEFLMGSPDSDKDAQGGEKPQHRVRITKPFYQGKYLVTQEQWEAVMGNNPSHFKGPKNPVETVSWDNCQKFLEKLNEKVGGGRFSLPTEAQWEYACRAGSKTGYCFGDDESELGDYAWYSANSGSRTHPVGEKKPNARGLYDMHGNVWEWCHDWYDTQTVNGSRRPSAQAP